MARVSTPSKDKRRLTSSTALTPAVMPLAENLQRNEKQRADREAELHRLIEGHGL